MRLYDGFKFIDLFSGIGGFHQAMNFFGGKCVLASEIDKDAIQVYKANYGIDSDKDITSINALDVPDHDVLCAGFPCQAFSKAGKQLGFADKTRGTLFFEIIKILKAKHPKYFILENVPNLISHDGGNTYKVICGALKEVGYRIPAKPLILSPHQFGVPQVRTRIFIPGIYEPNFADEPINFTFDNLKKKSDNTIDSVLESRVDDPDYKISEKEEKIINAWDDFHKSVDLGVIGFPIWSSYFKTTYINPSFPDWKKDFVRKNQELYERNKAEIDKWLKRWNFLADFTETQKKFEWQCGDAIDSAWDAVIQIRPSGVRVKRPDCFQTLVALVQLPIIGKYRRTLTVKEAARLQSFPDDFIPASKKSVAFRQFGNSVNVRVVEEVFKKLLEL